MVDGRMTAMRMRSSHGLELPYATITRTAPFHCVEACGDVTGDANGVSRGASGVDVSGPVRRPVDDVSAVAGSGTLTRADRVSRALRTRHGNGPWMGMVSDEVLELQLPAAPTPGPAEG